MPHRVIHIHAQAPRKPAEGRACNGCGVVDEPDRWLPWLPAALARRLALRWIAAADGCDSDLQTA